MGNNLSSSASSFKTNGYRPVFYNMALPAQADTVLKLAQNPETNIYNTIKKQIEELIRIQNPGAGFSQEEMEQRTAAHLNGVNADDYGVWVYYPWNKNLVHLLDRDEFIKIRTNRNIYKISPPEIELLQTKKVAIIGLSVGQSIAQTIAMERICGEMRLADFDSLELGNLNRLNAGVQDLGLPKVVIAARKIAEIDPYIAVKCWSDGINENNIDEFLSADGKADVLIEECDGIDIKILSRVKARGLGIPVIMDTNDMGMLDVERFDLEEGRSIFHDRLPEIENLPVAQLMEQLQNLTIEQKIGYLSKIIGLENISDEMQVSLSQMNKTITGWPQLASAVILGAAMVTDTCRRILLNKFNKSGRYFIDFQKLIC